LLREGAQAADRYAGWTWASPFLPTSFAGVQVALQAWVGRGTALSLTTDFDSVWRELNESRVDALSCTPTFADLLLQNEPRPEVPWRPRQITLGGEVLRPAIGRRLRERFPATTFSVIYAAAEFGILLKTHRVDGWYEAKGLDQHGVPWRVVDGCLELSDGKGWRSTGDQVELCAGLIRVIGRADAVANVAGSKVSLNRVSELAEEVPGIRRAVATAEANLITGQVVCLKYAVEAGWDPDAVREAAAVHLRAHLPKPAWPRKWVMDVLGVGPNAKRPLR
jgi:acyl-CoA synthetase (AMP-forming)/AMP-acid ligase II